MAECIGSDGLRAREGGEWAKEKLEFLSYYGAARAGECAHRAGKFAAMERVLFRKQDSIGLKSWKSFADEVGILDLSRFDSCVNGADSFPRIESGIEAGRRLGIRGTPTVVINGWHYSGALSPNVLELAVTRVLNGETPFPAR